MTFRINSPFLAAEMRPLKQGDMLSVSLPDGKGVSGFIAGVDIAPGGLPFSIIVTHNGQPPTDTDEAPEASPEELPGDERGNDAREEIAALTEALRRAKHVEEMLRIDVDRQTRRVARQRERIETQNAQAQSLMIERDEARRAASEWEAQYHTLNDLVTQGSVRVDADGTTTLPGEMILNAPMMINNFTVHEEESPSSRVRVQCSSDGTVVININGKD